MSVLDHDSQPMEEWRPGVRTRMRVSALTGAAQLCVFDQFIDPGQGAPTHRHAVEEVLSVLQGSAEVWVGEARHALTAGQSVVVPAGESHGFRNTGTTTLHVQAILAAASFEAAYEDGRERSRRWFPLS
jgi:quercetin dioxygenase-like cupin family protein